MLENALLYKDEIEQRIKATWYDPKYQYYYGSQWRNKYNIGDDSWGRYFASIDSNKEVLGLIQYVIDPETRRAYNLAIINLSKNKITFGKDVSIAIDEMFTKFGVEVLHFSVFKGNHIEKNYDRMVAKAGGKILCERKNKGVDLAGNILDDKLYEVTKEEYLQAKANKFKKVNNEI